MQKGIHDYSDEISHEFLIRVESIYGNLKSAERKAVHGILDNPKYLVNSTIVDMAKLAQCSEATFVRLSKKLGFSGYAQLKNFVIDFKNESPFPYKGIVEEDDSTNIIDKVFESIKQALTDTQSLLDKNQYELALKYILNSKRMFFAGAGDAYTVAYSAYLKFLRLGFSAGCAQDLDVQLIEASKLAADDVLVIITHSGETASLYNLAKYVKVYGVKIVTITNYPLSPIARQSDAVLLTAIFTSNIYNETMAKRIPELSIIEALYISVLMHSSDDKKNFFAKTTRAVSLNKM